MFFPATHRTALSAGVGRWMRGARRTQWKSGRSALRWRAIPLWAPREIAHVLSTIDVCIKNRGSGLCLSVILLGGWDRRDQDALARHPSPPDKKTTLRPRLHAAQTSGIYTPDKRCGWRRSIAAATRGVCRYVCLQRPGQGERVHSERKEEKRRAKTKKKRREEETTGKRNGKRNKKNKKTSSPSRASSSGK